MCYLTKHWSRYHPQQRPDSACRGVVLAVFLAAFGDALQHQHVEHVWYQGSVATSADDSAWLMVSAEQKVRR